MNIMKEERAEYLYGYRSYYDRNASSMNIITGVIWTCQFFGFFSDIPSFSSDTTSFPWYLSRSKKNWNFLDSGVQLQFKCGGGGVWWWSPVMEFYATLLRLETSWWIFIRGNFSKMFFSLFYTPVLPPNLNEGGRRKGGPNLCYASLHPILFDIAKYCVKLHFPDIPSCAMPFIHKILLIIQKFLKLKTFLGLSSVQCLWCVQCSLLAIMSYVNDKERKEVETGSHGQAMPQQPC